LFRHRGSSGCFLQSTGFSCDWDGATGSLKVVFTGDAASGTVAVAIAVPPNVTHSAIIRVVQTFFHEVISCLLNDWGRCCASQFGSRGNSRDFRARSGKCHEISLLRAEAALQIQLDASPRGNTDRGALGNQLNSEGFPVCRSTTSAHRPYAPPATLRDGNARAQPGASSSGAFC
jgi:hypothetical protein